MRDGCRETPFILSFLSPETGCPSHQMRFLADPEDVSSLLEYQGDIERVRFTLDARDIAALGRRFGLDLPPGQTWAELNRPHLPFDHSPYLIHTGYELPLMLDGRKPFAFFSDTSLDDEPLLGELRAFFRPHVEAGRIVETFSCQKQLWPATDGGVKTAWVTELFYNLPGEEWRIAAWKALIAERAGRWRDEDTREEGRLLGYAQDQCDWYIAALCELRRNLQSHDTSA